MVVEDDRQLTEAITDVLTSHGYEVNICSTYDNVFSCITAKEPNLIVLDGYLQEHDGQQLLQPLKLVPATRHIPVIFASVMTEKDLEGCYPDALLNKSFGMKKLLDAVSRLV